MIRSDVIAMNLFSRLYFGRRRKGYVVTFALCVFLLTLTIYIYRGMMSSQAHQDAKIKGRNTNYANTNYAKNTKESDADRFQREVRVLVWVMTSPISVERARVVMETWGSRVDPGMLLFFTSASNGTEAVTKGMNVSERNGDIAVKSVNKTSEESASSLPLPMVELNVSEGRGHLTAKTMKAFDYLHKHYRHKADFFMKADDDTYVVMENLRFYLQDLNPNTPFVTGRRFKNKVKQGFPSGGAGYVLSRAALIKLTSRKRNPPVCAEDGYEEDVRLGLCLEKLGVPILNSTDSEGRSRFHAYPPWSHLDGIGLPRDYQKWDANVVRLGSDAISDYPISFHYIKPRDMRLLHFLFYKVRLYGLEQ